MPGLITYPIQPVVRLATRRSHSSPVYAIKGILKYDNLLSNSSSGRLQTRALELDYPKNPLEGYPVLSHPSSAQLQCDHLMSNQLGYYKFDASILFFVW